MIIKKFLFIFPASIHGGRSHRCPITAESPALWLLAWSVCPLTVWCSDLVSMREGTRQLGQGEHRRGTRTSTEVHVCCPFLSLALTEKLNKAVSSSSHLPWSSPGGLLEYHLPSSVVREGLWKWTCTYSEACPRPHFCASWCLQDFCQDLLFSLSSPSTVMIAWHSILQHEFSYTFGGTRFTKKRSTRKVSICSVELFASQEVMVS